MQAFGHSDLNWNMSNGLFSVRLLFLFNWFVLISACPGNWSTRPIIAISFSSILLHFTSLHSLSCLAVRSFSVCSPFVDSLSSLLFSFSLNYSILFDLDVRVRFSLSNRFWFLIVIVSILISVSASWFHSIPSLSSMLFRYCSFHSRYSFTLY